VQYLMNLLGKYFPTLQLKTSDILSAYVGVRPLVGATAPMSGDEGAGGKHGESSDQLQKVSREHHIDRGPGGTIIVAGGKYTTHRKMGEEIVDFTLKAWRKDAKAQKSVTPPSVGPSRTLTPINPHATFEAIERCRTEAAAKSIQIPEELLSRYGAEAVSILEAHVTGMASGGGGSGSAIAIEDPAGFPLLKAQLRHAMQSEMVVHLEDFYLRRMPLYAARADHGLPWAEELSRVWAEERGLSASEAQVELNRLQVELARRSAWRRNSS
ncbi:glycerol-3-phosphate dehydrogenase C-terminal domain-containing protein, partial [Bdellovibrionota bacterium FG-1]